MPSGRATSASSPSMRTSTDGNAERAREEPTTQTPIPKAGRLSFTAGRSEPKPRPARRAARRADPA